MIAAVPGAGSVALIWPTPATCADLVCAFDAECKALARAGVCAERYGQGDRGLRS